MKTKFADFAKNISQQIDRPKIENPKLQQNRNTEQNKDSLINNFQQNGILRRNLLFSQFDKTQLQTVAGLLQTPIDPADVEEEANQMIEDNGGRENLNTQALGEDLAEIARTDPARAWAIMQVILGDKVDTDGKGIVKDHDKDQIVSSMINSLSDSGDLADLAATPEGRAMLQRAQQHMYAGNSSDDEKAIADEIQRALLPYMIFSEVYEGISGVSGNAPFDPNLTPEEAALAINTSVTGSTSELNIDVNAFNYQLEQHKDDPQWLAAFYSALGSDRAGELISASVSPGTYNIGGFGGNPEVMQQNAATIRASFEAMYAAGLITQTDLEVLVKDINDNPYVALEIFGKSDNTELQNAFINAVVKSGSDQSKAAVIAMISQMPVDRQNQLLGALSQEALNSLMTGAMRGSTEIHSLSDLIAQNYDGEMIKIGDVTGLMQSAADNTFPVELKQKLFLAASFALKDDKAYKNFDNNNELREAMNQIFLDETPPSKPGSDNLFMRMASTTNGRLNPDEKGALAGFFAFSVFSPNQVGNSYQLEARVRELFTTAGTNMSNAQGAYGLSPQAYAALFGGLYKSLEDGLNLMQNRHQNDENQRKQAIGFFVGVVTSMIPGVNKYLPSNIDIFDPAVGNVQGRLQGKVEQAVIDFINSLFGKAQDGLLNNDDLKSILEGFADILPPDILGSFNDGYGGI